jgi:hypothetical protein
MEGPSPTLKNCQIARDLLLMRGLRGRKLDLFGGASLAKKL